MMTRTLLVRCAPIAIAASAALPAVPAVAQDAVTAEPVIVLPEPAPAAPAVTIPEPTPTIVMPETMSAPEPVAVENEVAAPVAGQRTTRAAGQRSAPRAAPVQGIAPAAAVSSQTAAPVAEAPVLADTATPVAATAAPAPVRASSPDNTGEIAVASLLGALGLAAVGGIAFAAARRRRRNAVLVHEPVAAASEPLAAEGQDEVFAFTPPQPAVGAFTAPALSATATPRTSARVSGDPIPLPREVPETFEERDALLKELVAAEPDKANPFTGLRARARRAKLIMQSLGQDFRDRKPRIDLSEYTNRWPALRGWQPATA